MAGRGVGNSVVGDGRGEGRDVDEGSDRVDLDAGKEEGRALGENDMEPQAVRRKTRMAIIHRKWRE